MNQQQEDDCSSIQSVENNSFLLSLSDGSEGRTLGALQRTSQQLDGILDDLSKEIFRESVNLVKEDEDCNTSDDEEHGEKQLRAELDSTNLPPWAMYLVDLQDKLLQPISKRTSMQSKSFTCSASTSTEDLERPVEKQEKVPRLHASMVIDDDVSTNGQKETLNRSESGPIGVNLEEKLPTFEEATHLRKESDEVSTASNGDIFVELCGALNSSRLFKKAKSQRFTTRLFLTILFFLIVIGVLATLLSNREESTQTMIVIGDRPAMSTSHSTFAPTQRDQLDTGHTLDALTTTTWPTSTNHSTYVPTERDQLETEDTLDVPTATTWPIDSHNTENSEDEDRFPSYQPTNHPTTAIKGRDPKKGTDHVP